MVRWLIKKLFKTLIRLTLVAYVTVSFAMILWTFQFPERDVTTLKPVDAIICLGGGMNAQGVLAEATRTRVDRCVELYDAGLAPVVIFTGGRPTENSLSAGGQMSAYARRNGLPASAAISEDAAHSTLQNALFSLPLIPDAQSIILVTEAFHLPRSLASFEWANWELDLPPKTITIVMSEPVRRTAGGDVNWRILFRESIALWFNAGRAVAYSIAPNPSLDWLH